jgi:tetratricopeptide (TPR) repeat protein
LTERNCDAILLNNIYMKKNIKDEETFKRFEIGLYEAALRSNPNNIEALRSLGHIYTTEGLHEKALEIDRRLVRLLPEESVAHYNLACSLSQLMKIDEAFNALEMAVLLGYTDWKHMAKDADLDNLRNDSRYQSLMALIKKKYVV